LRSLAAYGEVFHADTLCLASGVIPQISAESWAPAQAAPSTLPPFNRLRDHGAAHRLHVHHRPRVIHAVTGQQVAIDELGGHAGAQRAQRRRPLLAENESQAIDLGEASFVPTCREKQHEDAPAN